MAYTSLVCAKGLKVHVQHCKASKKRYWLSLVTEVVSGHNQNQNGSCVGVRESSDQGAYWSRCWECCTVAPQSLGILPLILSSYLILPIKTKMVEKTGYFLLLSPWPRHCVSYFSWNSYRPHAVFREIVKHVFYGRYQEWERDYVLWNFIFRKEQMLKDSWLSCLLTYEFCETKTV